MENWNAIVEDAIKMINNPNNEYEVRNLLYQLDGDVFIEDGSNLTPTAQVLKKLKEMGEMEIAANVVYPLYNKEINELQSTKNEQ